ncbi:protein of unknown function [Ruminococcaceae bacterium BL-6]|nr:protein of unknown function [Ruminococcaceae bacterium BL-6]
MSSKRSTEIKKRYVGYYIGCNPNDRIDYPTIEYLTSKLEQDNVYAVLRKIHIDWMEETIPEWCIWKVFMSRETLLEHCYNLEQLNDRVYKINEPLYIATI